MKTSIRNMIYKTSILWLVFSFALVSAAQVSKVEKAAKVAKVEKIQERTEQKEEGPYKTISRQITLDKRAAFKLNFYDAKVTIEPAKGDAVEVQVNYRLTTSDASVEARLRQEMEKYLITREGNQVNITTQFYKSYFSGFDVLHGRRTEIELNDGTKLKVDEFEVADVKIYMPADADLDLTSKYGKVNIDFSLDGTFKANAYDAQVKGKSIRGNSVIESKYSKFEFESMGNVQYKGYEASLTAETVKDLDLDSKYSEIEINQLGNIKYKGYEDKVEMETMNTITIDSKFTEIDLGICTILSAKLYEGKLEVEKAKSIGLDAKYVTMDFEQCHVLKLDNGYENEIDINSVDSLLSVNGKYNEWDIDELSGYLKIDGYEDDIRLDLLKKDFSNVIVSGKYIDFDMETEKGIAYQLKGTIQYPEMDVEKSDYKVVVHDKQSDKLIFDYNYGRSSKGQLIQIDGYEVHVSIENQ